MKVKSLNCVRLFMTPWTAAHRLLRPWDFPGKSTRVGCHCLLQGNLYFRFIDYAKAFDCVDHNKLENSSKDGNYQTTLPPSWEICIQIKKQQLELDMEQQTGSKSGQE